MTIKKKANPHLSRKQNRLNQIKLKQVKANPPAQEKQLQNNHLPKKLKTAIHQEVNPTIKKTTSAVHQTIQTAKAQKTNRIKLITTVQSQRQATQTAQKHQNQTAIQKAVQSNQVHHLQKHKALKLLHSQPMNTNCRLFQIKNKSVLVLC